MDCFEVILQGVSFCDRFAFWFLMVYIVRLFTEALNGLFTSIG